MYQILFVLSHFFSLLATPKGIDTAIFRILQIKKPRNVIYIWIQDLSPDLSKGAYILSYYLIACGKIFILIIVNDQNSLSTYYTDTFY